MDRILGYIEHGNKEGAQCLTGGKRFGSKGYFVEPTLFTGVTDNMKIAKEEIFGPVMNVLKFKTLDEVIGAVIARIMGWPRPCGPRTSPSAPHRE